MESRNCEAEVSQVPPKSQICALKIFPIILPPMILPPSAPFQSLRCSLRAPSRPNPPQPATAIK